MDLERALGAPEESLEKDRDKSDQRRDLEARKDPGRSYGQIPIRLGRSNRPVCRQAYSRAVRGSREYRPIQEAVCRSQTILERGVYESH
jgi:hypothetical protein